MDEINTSISPFHQNYDSQSNIKNQSIDQSNFIDKTSIQSIFINHAITSKSDLLQREVNKNEDIIIFSITAKVNNTEFSWKIYKTYNQIRTAFNLIRKELKKEGKIDFQIKTKCKTIKHYTNIEIVKNIQTIASCCANFILNEAKDCIALKEFLGISVTSFSENNAGLKPFEGIGLKEAEPRCFRLTLRIFCNFLEFLCYKQWNQRWLMLRNDMICYLNSSTTLVGKNVYWFDEEIDVSRPYDNNILVIQNLSRKLVLKFDSDFECELWHNEINRRINVIKDEIMNNIYSSFTTQKDFCNARFFIDGEEYFSTLFELLLQAKESVFITDWWLSPEMFLRRPIVVDDYINGEGKKERYELSRFMDVVNYIAHRGVKVYILVYREVSIALPLDSLHTKTTLNNLHNNIRVTRHPKATLDFLWSHHEKLVIIDQRIAFVGGLDICWGRYDTHNHPIVEEENDNHQYMFPGIDFSNARIRDFSNVSNYLRESVSRKDHCRMPWHDVHSMLEGPVVADVARHFVERWNHARFENRNMGIVGVRQVIEGEKNISGSIESSRNINLSKSYKEQFVDSNKQSIELQDSLINTNIISNLNQNPNKEQSDSDDEEGDTNENTNNNNKKRKSVYEHNLRFDGIGENDIDNNTHSSPSSKDNITNSFKRSEKKKATLGQTIKTATKQKYKKFMKAIKNYAHKKGKSNKKLCASVMLNDPKDLLNGNRDFKCQVLRSCSYWSIGKNKTENSILQGYYKLIDNAKHYIYIENQFFISKSYTEEERLANPNSISQLVENEIALHIRTRIERAFEDGTNFKVYIFIPILPGFDGEVDKSPTVSVILKYTYQTLSHNYGLSLFETLYKKMGDEIDNYLVVFSLRNHALLNGIPVTELIYIHSKLMIVDDERVLIGSANINDRSLLGSRDSEFAVIIEQKKDFKSKMDGKEKSVAKFAHDFRRNLMAEHLGVQKDHPLLEDPVSDSLMQLMKTTAKNNTLMYREIFNCYPDDKFDTFESLKTRKLPETEEDYRDLLIHYNKNKDNIIGHIVQFPLDFMKNQKLGLDILCKENLIPEKNFT